MANKRLPEARWLEILLCQKSEAKYYSFYWVGTRGRVVAGSKYYLNKKKAIDADVFLSCHQIKIIQMTRTSPVFTKCWNVFSESVNQNACLLR